MKNMTESLVVGGVALLVGLLLGWMVRGVATYNTAMETVTTYQDWRVACPPAKVAKDQPCELVQEILDGKSRNVVARMAITRENGKPVMGFTLPFGVLLPAGVGLQFGKDPVRIVPFRTCNSVGCIAVTDLDDKLKSQLGSASDVKLLFAGQDQKAVAIPISVNGYKQANSAYTGGEKRRASWFWRLWS